MKRSLAVSRSSGFFSWAESLRESFAREKIWAFEPVRNDQRLRTAPYFSAYALRTGGVSKSGKVVSETSFESAPGGRESCKSFISRVMVRHGPGQVVKIMSAIQILPRSSAKVKAWPF